MVSLGNNDKAPLIFSDISPHLPSSLPLNLLPTLRPYFAPHPSLSSASRPLKTTTGGKDVNMDMHEIQPFKSAAGWGSHNILRWCASRLTADEVEKNLGLVLPPTLVMMDDYEPSWRETGATVLESWTFKLDPAALHRMGLDALLLKSLIHTLSLHPNPPVYKVLPITLHLIEYTNPPGRERTELYGNIMEKHFVQGWVYAPSGIEGKVVSIGLAEELIIMCDLLGPAIVRWLKVIRSLLLFLSILTCNVRASFPIFLIQFSTRLRRPSFHIINPISPHSCISSAQ